MVTIENIWLQVFEDELEELRKTELATIQSVEGIGFIARFAFTIPAQFPVQLSNVLSTQSYLSAATSFETVSGTAPGVAAERLNEPDFVFDHNSNDVLIWTI